MLPILERFGLTASDLIAQGGESSVYALGRDRILRVGRAGVRHPVRKYELFREIEDGGLPWRLPMLLEHGSIDGHDFAVESRLPGRSLDVVLSELRGTSPGDLERQRVLRSYADGALRIRDANVERPWFGELYHEPPVRDVSWPNYLVERAGLQIEKAGAAFAEEVPNLEEVIAWFARDVREIGPFDRGLVHGDYFPGNVLVDETLEVTAVIDFGWSTLVGDPRLDAVCASVFLEVERPWCAPHDAAFVREHVERSDPSISPIFELYRTFCALHFSFVIHYGIPLYRWCVNTLREPRHGHQR